MPQMQEQVQTTQAENLGGVKFGIDTTAFITRIVVRNGIVEDLRRAALAKDSPSETAGVLRNGIIRYYGRGVLAVYPAAIAVVRRGTG